MLDLRKPYKKKQLKRCLLKPYSSAYDFVEQLTSPLLIIKDILAAPIHLGITIFYVIRLLITSPFILFFNKGHRKTKLLNQLSQIGNQLAEPFIDLANAIGNIFLYPFILISIPVKLVRTAISHEKPENTFGNPIKYALLDWRKHNGDDYYSVNQFLDDIVDKPVDALNYALTSIIYFIAMCGSILGLIFTFICNGFNGANGANGANVSNSKPSKAHSQNNNANIHGSSMHSQGNVIRSDFWLFAISLTRSLAGSLACILALELVIVKSFHTLVDMLRPVPKAKTEQAAKANSDAGAGTPNPENVDVNSVFYPEAVANAGVYATIYDVKKIKTEKAAAAKAEAEKTYHLLDA